MVNFALGLRVTELVRTEDERARCRFESTIGEALDQRDGLGRLFHYAEPAKIGAHDADQLVADLLGVHNDSCACGKETVELVEEHATPLVNVVAGEKWHVSTWHSKLVVGMQIVWSAADVHNAMEVVLAQPDDFFLSSNLAMAGTVSTGTLTDGELILYDPNEITGLDSKGPLATEFLRHRVTMLPHVAEVNF